MIRTLLILASFAALQAVGAQPERPNVLWITSEDNSPYLGCYGDQLAQTPNLDRLAKEGLRYRNAFATSPVCSSARTTLITGMHACALGALNHRSNVEIPKAFKLYPEHLRAAGYYCTNNSKTDYNVAIGKKVWDESSKDAHYKKRAADQPFFAIFNLTSSHESQVAPKPSKSEFRIPPEQVPLPPYHPDTPDIRRDWANYYDQMTLMDQQAGVILAELEKAGLADETIVFYYGDHGGALPRGKRNIHDSGTRVPLIVRIPEKWAHLAPAKPGEWVDDLVSFVDLPTTLLNVCDVPVPDHYQGQPFIGRSKVAPREHVFLYRARMDERYDTVRAIRDREFRYVRNYSPHRPWGQHYSYPFQVQPSMRSWYAEYEGGRCNEIQSTYWKAKPAEELYQLADDPHEIKNLAADPIRSKRLEEMREKLRQEMVAVRDTGFIPEGMSHRLAGRGTIYDYAQSQAYPIERVIEVADRASDGRVADLPQLMKALEDEHPVIRYWGATGCLILQKGCAPAKEKLRALLNDEWPDIQVVAAEALAYLGESEMATDVIARVIKKGEPYEVLAAQNALDYMRLAGHVPLARAQAIVRGIKFKEPGDRIPKYLLTEAK